MIISNLNREHAILDDIMDTLKQLKQGGKLNQKLVLDTVAAECTVSFYVDEERTDLLFSQNQGDNPEQFTVSGDRTFYTPPDELLNFCPTTSDRFSQPIYYVTAEFGEYAEMIQTTYRNVDNLVFQRVIVSTKPNPTFAENENAVVIVPGKETVKYDKTSDDLAFVTIPFALYVQLLVHDWENLSEENRYKAESNVCNLVRNALYRDRYRGENATLVSEDLNGTNVGDFTPLPSQGVLKGMLMVRCAYRASSEAY